MGDDQFAVYDADIAEVSGGRRESVAGAEGSLVDYVVKAEKLLIAWDGDRRKRCYLLVEKFRGRRAGASTLHLSAARYNFIRI